MAILAELEAGGQGTSSRILCDHIAPLIVRDPDGRDRLQAVVDRWWRASVGHPETFGRIHPLRLFLNRMFRSRVQRWVFIFQLFMTGIAGVGIAVGLLGEAWTRVNVADGVVAGQGGDAPRVALDQAPSVATLLSGETPVPVLTAAAAMGVLSLGWAATILLRRSGLRRGRRADRSRLTELYLDSAGARLEARRLDRVADRFRTPGLGPSRIDVPASVMASARAAGVFTVVERIGRSLPDYTILIDRRSGLDHAARWAEAVSDALARAGLGVRRYFFEGAPDRVRDDRGGRPAALRTLRISEEERLILFGDGVDLASALGPRWFEGLDPWERRVFIDSSQAGVGGAIGIRSEAGPDEGASAPATLGGLAEAARQLASDVAPGNLRGGGAKRCPLPPFLFSDRAGLTTDTPPSPEDLDRLDRELASWLGPATYRWLCACAVYPTIHPDLTASLGRLLQDHLGRPVSLSTGAGRLNGLPWLRVGDMPDWLRVRLIGRLGAGDSTIIRACIRRMLDGLRRGPGTAGPAGVRFGRPDQDGVHSDRPFIEFMARRVQHPDRPSLAATRALGALLAPLGLGRDDRRWRAAIFGLGAAGAIGAGAGFVWARDIAGAPGLLFAAILGSAAIGLLAFTAAMISALYAGTLELEESLKAFIDEIAAAIARLRKRSGGRRGWASQVIWVIEAAFGHAADRADRDTRVRIFLVHIMFAVVFILIALAATMAALVD
ncbi:hypothetical protein ACIQC9_07100 [Brevundimonas sp. NPDC092305]|uniref:hypothetical protein n=1 Tax=Brevundimonas sp. NPDC092305 TaxID=3363957 RepID=UPI0038235883